ncbi:Transposase [Marinitoga hydrogenitolerans DSM 16785]|uniref:Transposase n=1 Tax=Marinitoga hydrogenitolerans (strain DSM 16785 / JCM 12826 / AT1271) TaxID=1122195 RepID=A0A1M4V7F0_MARH1|nr:transposase [Marinitoga hydrogenitolerans]SHE64895.1 Transposase [Marinitoga hydrogenitolerans DSM 16785]
MTIEDLKDDKDAENFLIELEVLKIEKKCPYCGNTEVYTVRRNHLKCKNCRREWSKYNNTIFKDIRIKPLKFLKIVHAIAKGKILKKISLEIGVSYNTVLKIKNLILKRLLKRIFNIDEVKPLFSIGIKIKEENITLDYIEEINLKELSKLKNEKIGRLYLFKNIKDFDLLIVFSEKNIKEFEEKSDRLNIKSLKKDLRDIIKSFSQKVFQGKISNIDTLLYTLTHCHLNNENEEDELFYFFLEILKN